MKCLIVAAIVFLMIYFLISLSKIFVLGQSGCVAFNPFVWNSDEYYDGEDVDDEDEEDIAVSNGE